MGRLSISFRDPKSARFLVGASSSSNATARYPPEPNFEAVTVVLLRGGTGVRLRARRMGAGLIPNHVPVSFFPFSPYYGYHPHVDPEASGCRDGSGGHLGGWLIP